MMQMPKMSKFLAVVQNWIEVSNQRKALRELSDRQLADIGISREQATREASKAFWESSRSQLLNQSRGLDPTATFDQECKI